MSVCFFVPADQAGTSTAEESLEQEGPAEDSADTQHQNLQQFWAKVTDDIRKVTAEDFKTQALPLARIKKIMKLDDEVKMISAEAPVLFAKAAEIFIHELTMRAWNHTEDNKRRTLQRNDIAMAISKSDQFDFLIDIVPRHEVKPSKPREDPPRHTATEHVVQQQQTLPTSNQQQFVIQPCAQVVQQQSHSAAPSVVPQPVTLVQQVVTPQGDVQQLPQQSHSAAPSVVPQPVTLVQQVVTPQGDVQQLPLQLTQAQLNMIRLQVQNNPTQPIIIQAQPHNSQIIQVSSQAQHQPQQQVFLQVASQEDS